MSVQAKLKKSQDQRYCVRLVLDHPDKINCDGVVMHMTPQLVVVCYEGGEMRFDGIAAIPRLKILSIEDDAPNRVRNEVLQFSGQISKLKIPAWMLRCGTILDVLHELKKRDIWPSLELADVTDSWFYIGQLLQVDNDGFVFRKYSATGRWYRKEDIALASLVTLTFGDSYGTKFNNYMRSKPK